MKIWWGLDTSIEEPGRQRHVGYPTGARPCFRHDSKAGDDDGLRSGNLYSRLDRALLDPLHSHHEKKQAGARRAACRALVLIWRMNYARNALVFAGGFSVCLLG